MFLERIKVFPPHGGLSKIIPGLPRHHEYDPNMFQIWCWQLCSVRCNTSLKAVQRHDIRGLMLDSKGVHELWWTNVAKHMVAHGGQLTCIVGAGCASHFSISQLWLPFELCCGSVVANLPFCMFGNWMWVFQMMQILSVKVVCNDTTNCSISMQRSVDFELLQSCFLQFHAFAGDATRFIPKPSTLNHTRV